jgi:transposase
LYANIKKAYDLAQNIRNIVGKTTDKVTRLSKLEKWHVKVNQSELRSFATSSISIINYYQTLLNYFDNRGRNASAEMKLMTSFKNHYKHSE